MSIDTADTDNHQTTAPALTANTQTTPFLDALKEFNFDTEQLLNM